MFINNYDIIVVGGGHAGCEAAAAAGRLGSKVLLITMNLPALVRLSCNPAMGGIAKGQIIREIDALGGYTGIVTDHTMIQFRMLNRSKGPAMWSPRAQNDRHQYTLKWHEILADIPNVHLWQDMVTEIIVNNNVVCGVKAKISGQLLAKAVIITGGTFLNGIIHVGEVSFGGGRLGEERATGLTEQLNHYGIYAERLKTGTPVRVDKRSIDLTGMTEQKGDEPPGRFSFTDTPQLKNQLSCYLAYTNEKVHDILRTGFERSPLFTGRIEGTGPRYCPSIEDKIERFSERNRHQLFIEPDGNNSSELYINGFSSSLPIEIQYQALRQIEGFEHARIMQPGYAIEYDFFPPTQLNFTLESKVISKLYFAGQVNGTTGYEEAAAQGIMAGINAHRMINEEGEIVLKRSEAYIGVLIDDLITKGTREPYRMFTSRAEFRILLRQDNADKRLTHLGYRIGLADKERMDRVRKKTEIITEIDRLINEMSVTPEFINTFLKKQSTACIERKTKYARILLRPQIDLEGLIAFDQNLKSKVNNLTEDKNLLKEAIESAEIAHKYSGYIKKESENAEKIGRLEHLNIPKGIDYMQFSAMSMESREKLQNVKPDNIGQASRISGITPSDISVLLVHIGR